MGNFSGLECRPKAANFSVLTSATSGKGGMSAHQRQLQATINKLPVESYRD